MPSISEDRFGDDISAKLFFDSGIFIFRMSIVILLHGITKELIGLFVPALAWQVSTMFLALKQFSVVYPPYYSDVEDKAFSQTVCVQSH